MLQPADIFSALRAEGVRFFTGVPDSLLKDFCAYVTDHAPACDHVIAANEGAAIGLAAGHHLATGGLPLVYLQNSGLGNTINPLMSLADREVYSLPVIVMIGWRGEPGVKDEPQHVKQGRVMLATLDAMEMPYRVLSDDPARALEDIAWIAQRAREGSEPVALVVRKGAFASYALQKNEAAPFSMPREQAIEEVVAALDPQDAVVATTGMISRELFEIRKRRGEASRDFLTVGAMGHASAIACGVANARPERQVFCLDGDGAMLMHMGSVAIQGQVAGANFKHVVINNGCHDSVGGQPTVGFRVNLADVARACGYRVLEFVTEPERIGEAVRALRAADGPAMLEIRVRKGARKDLGRPTSSPIENKQAFMRFLSDADA